MGVPFKKIPRRDPRKEDAVAKFYPQLVTLGDNADLEDVAYVMKEKSSLTLGDIKSVITNFVEALIDKLYGEHQGFRGIQPVGTDHRSGEKGGLHG